MKTVPVATFNEREPAVRLQQRLEAAGFTAVVTDQSKIERFWFVSEPLAAIHLEVEPSRYLEARRLIEDWDRTNPVLTDAVRCPECHSSRVEYPQMTRKFVTPSIGVVLMLLRLVPREFYCLDCHYTWPKESKAPEPDRDLLGWPVRKRRV